MHLEMAELEPQGKTSIKNFNHYNAGYEGWMDSFPNEASTGERVPRRNWKVSWTIDSTSLVTSFIQSWNSNECWYTVVGGLIVRVTQ